eukprot:5240025-Amphidinium_carterae.1
MQSFACTVTTDHLRFHFVATNPARRQCQNTTIEVGKASCSHKQQSSHIVVSGVCADSSSRCR